MHSILSSETGCNINNSFFFHGSQRFTWYQTKTSHYHIIAVSAIMQFSSGNLCRNQLNQEYPFSSHVALWTLIPLQSQWISVSYAHSSSSIQHFTCLKQKMFWMLERHLFLANNQSYSLLLHSSAFPHISTLLFIFSVFYTICRLHGSGLVVRVLGYRSGGLGSIPGTTRFSGKKK
jgi:hypothetical protein